MKRIKPKLRSVGTQSVASPAGGTSLTKPATREQTKFSRHVTPSDFKKAFRNAQAGNPNQLFAILRFFQKMDDEIPSAMQSLVSAILGENFIITPADDSEEAKQQAEVLKQVFKKINMYELAENLIESHYFGMSAVSIPAEAWKTETIAGRSYQIPTYYQDIPMDWIYAKKEHRSEDFNELHVGEAPYTDYTGSTVILMTSKKLPDFEDIDFTDFGKGLAAIRFAVFKYFNEEDAASFNEVFATPLILGKVGPGGKEEVVSKAVNEMANDARAVVGETDDISFPTANQSGSVDVFDRSAERWNKAISKILKSESLTNNMGSAGSYAAMYTTNGVRLDVAGYIGRRLFRVIDESIIKPISEMNFSGNLMVNVKLQIQAVEDALSKARVLREANNLIDLSKAQVYEELGLRAPADEEDTIPVKKSTTGLGF